MLPSYRFIAQHSGKHKSIIDIGWQAKQYRVKEHQARRNACLKAWATASSPSWDIPLHEAIVRWAQKIGGENSSRRPLAAYLIYSIYLRKALSASTILYQDIFYFGHIWRWIYAQAERLQPASVKVIKRHAGGKWRHKAWNT